MIDLLSKLGRVTRAWLRMTGSMAFRIVACCSIGVLASLLSFPLAASGETNPARLLARAKGRVPVYYSPRFEAQALKYQKTLIACQRWYDRKVRKHVDFDLIVLNKEDWGMFTDKNMYPWGAEYPYPFPYSQPSVNGPSRRAFVVLPAHFEDLTDASGFADDLELLVENISYHELGHLYAKAMEMETSEFLGEMYADIFMASFVRARRRDMHVFLQGPPAKFQPQRYSSLADFFYLYGDVGVTNNIWFQFQLYHLSDVLIRDKSLLTVIAELKNAFRDSTLPPFNYVAAQLEAIHPGLGAEMGPLWQPTTLPDARPNTCTGKAGSDKHSALVVQNASTKAVTLTFKAMSRSVAPNSWARIGGHPGEQVRTDPGLCFVFQDEPAIVRLPSQQRADLGP
jgi:hypothetical protein